MKAQFLEIVASMKAWAASHVAIVCLSAAVVLLIFVAALR